MDTNWSSRISCYYNSRHLNMVLYSITSKRFVMLAPIENNAAPINYENSLILIKGSLVLVALNL